MFFTNEEELNQWLRARRWRTIPHDEYDDDSYREWVADEDRQYIVLTEAIFEEEGRLKVYTEDTWNDEWLELKDSSDLPF